MQSRERSPDRNPLSDLESDVRDLPRRLRAIGELMATWGAEGSLKDDDFCCVQTLLNDTEAAAFKLEHLWEASFAAYNARERRSA